MQTSTILQILYNQHNPADARFPLGRYRLLGIEDRLSLSSKHSNLHISRLEPF